MTEVFLPFTAFHYASAIRALRAGAWCPERVLLLHGAVSTRSPGGERYAAAFRQALADHGVTLSEIAFSYWALIRVALRLNRRTDRLVSGNPRRSEALTLSRGVDEVFVIDDGLGTLIDDGYFSFAWQERSRLKPLLVKLGLLPAYPAVFAKITGHATIFARSVFPNPVTIPFEPIFALPPGQAETLSCIFVSSLLRQDQMAAYIAWVRQDFAPPPGCHLSIHPGMTPALAAELASALEMPVLDTGGVLLEEFVMALAAERPLTVIGQENTTTRILRELGGVRTDCRVFTG